MIPTAAPRLAALALALAGLAPSAQALSFVFTDIGGTPMSAAQLGAFQSAANYWSSKLTDNVTVYLNIAFDNLDSGILGSTNSNITTFTYSAVRSKLVADAKSALDAQAISHLQSGPALSFYANNADGSVHLDNDGSINNTVLGINTANAKAIGLAAFTDKTSPDATIRFGNAYAGDFVYTRAGGTPSNKTDFITVAEHEIGHALGFVSGVDDIDSCIGKPCASSFETEWWYYPLDLFRYSANGKLDETVGGSPYFSVNGGATSIQSFSTGVAHGNGQQASHFGTSVLNLMRPFVGNGQNYDASASDLAAFDAIGWDLAVAVPEPASYALLLSGLGALSFIARRRRPINA